MSVLWTGDPEPDRKITFEIGREQSRKPTVSDVLVVVLTGWGLLFGIAALLIFEARP